MAVLGGPNIVVAPKKVVTKKCRKRVGIVSSYSSSLGEAGAIDHSDPANFILGWEFQFLVPISGTPIGGGILIPFTIPKISVGFFFEIPSSGEPENWNSDLRFLEFRQFLAQKLRTSFCC
jgi:hypothetical protein